MSPTTCGDHPKTTLAYKLIVQSKKAGQDLPSDEKDDTQIGMAVEIKSLVCLIPGTVNGAWCCLACGIR
jgi:hypothetical protein